MFAAYSALAGLAFRSVAWLAVAPGVLLFIVGIVLAFAVIDTVNRGLTRRQQPTYVRRFATVACMVWALVLPTFLGAAGFAWGLGRGLGNMVEGPIGSSIRGAVSPWIASTDRLGSKLLGRWVLARRLSESEFTQVTQTAPRWLADALFPNDNPADWIKATGISIPPAVVTVLREGLLNAPQKHPTLFGSALRRLRSRSRGAAINQPTLKETLEAMISPDVFKNASRSIQDESWHYVGWLVSRAFVMAIIAAGLLRLLWRKQMPAPQPEAAAS